MTGQVRERAHGGRYQYRGSPGVAAAELMLRTVEYVAQGRACPYIKDRVMDRLVQLNDFENEWKRKGASIVAWVAPGWLYPGERYSHWI